MGVCGMLGLDNETSRGPVLIVSPESTVVEALAVCLNEAYGISAHPFSSAAELGRRMDSRRKAGLILVDSLFLENDGLEDAMVGDTPVALLTDQPSAETSAAVLEGRYCGALTKATPLRTAAAAIRLMLGGDVYLREHLPQTANTNDRAKLSERRTAIGTLIAAGKSNRQIQTELCLSASLVAAEIRTLLRHFGVRNRTELAMRWRSAG